jgi:hypothetical protein
MADANSTGRKAARRPAANQSAQHIANPPRLPTLPQTPVFVLRGERQPPEFAAGVATAMEILAVLDVTELGPLDWDLLTPEISARIADASQRGGKFSEGVMSTLCVYALGHITAGQPDLSVWVPFSQPWGGEDFEIPPEDSMFFDVKGKPYAVEPNLETKEWYSEVSCCIRNVESIRGIAAPITRAQFETMRWRRGQEARKANKRNAPEAT